MQLLHQTSIPSRTHLHRQSFSVYGWFCCAIDDEVFHFLIYLLSFGIRILGVVLLSSAVLEQGGRLP